MSRAYPKPSVNVYRVGNRSRISKRMSRDERRNAMNLPAIRSVPWSLPVPGRKEFMERQKVRLVDVTRIEIKDWIAQSGNKFRWSNRWTIVDWKRKSWQALSTTMLAAGRRRAEGCPNTFRVVRLTSWRRCRIRDRANLAEGYKFLIDAMTWSHRGGWGLIADDSDDWCEILYEQITGPERLGYVGTTIEVWELVWRGKR